MFLYYKLAFNVKLFYIYLLAAGTESRISTSTGFGDAMENDLEVICLSISPNEENVIASTRGHQIYSLLLSSADIATAKGDHPSFDLLIHSYHSLQITGRLPY